MKILPRVLWAIAFVAFSLGSSRAQTQPLPDDLVPIDPSAIVPNSVQAWWSMAHYGEWPPCPNECGNPEDNLYISASMPNNIFIDDRNDTGSMASPMGRFAALDDPGDSSGGDGAPLFQFSTNGLYLNLTNVGLGLAYLNLCNATNQVYAIWSATNLPPAWQVETEVWPTNSVVMPFTVPTLGRPNLFLLAEDWTGVTANGNTTPLWWFWANFASISLSDGDPDSQGIHTLGYDYAHGLDPNVISFIVTTTNQYVNSSLTPLQITIGAGVPSSMAVLVDNTNFAAAVWTNYNANPVASLGSTEGWHQVWVGLRGRLPTSQQTWASTRMKLLLSPPMLVITNPVSSVVSQPVIQLQGYCPEQLSSLIYSLTNAAGSVSNQPVLVLDEAYDTNNYEFTTNYFQAFDVRLALGTNTITLYATDLAGNTAMTNLVLTLDYSGQTNPPVLTLGWPQSSTHVGSDTFTCRGVVSDPTAQVAVQFVDTNGVTNTVNGRVGRDSSFWVENVPLVAGTNLLAMVVADAAGNSSSTALSVVRSDVTLTVDLASLEDEYAEGTVSDTNCTVWVNGTPADNWGDGYWTIDDLDLTLNNTVVQARAVPNSDNSGNGSGGASPPGNGGAASAEQGNPGSTNATDAETELAWPDAQIYAQSIHVSEASFYTPPSPDLSWADQENMNWQAMTGGTEGCTNWTGGVESDAWVTTWTAGTWPILGTGSNRDLLFGTTSQVGPPSESSFFYQGDYFPQYAWFYKDVDYSGPDGGGNQAVLHYHDGAQMTLVTGGAPGSSGVELYGISAANVEIDPVTGLPMTSNIPLDTVSLQNFGSFDTNGFMLVALPDRTPTVLAPQVAGMPLTSGATVGISQPVAPYFALYIGAQRYVLNCKTVATIPTNQDRSTLGVGEQVNLVFQPPLTVYGYWSCSTGSVYPVYGNHTLFTAPSNKTDSAAITFSYTNIYNGRSVVRTTNFTVVEPTGVDHADFVQYYSYTSTSQAGAGVQLRPYIGPTNVSFYRVQIMEVGEAASSLSGYFTTNNAPSHVGNGAGVWIQLDYDNHWLGDYDWAKTYDWSPPWTGTNWSGGSYTWNIPAVWQIGIGPTNSMSAWNQIHTLNANGTMQVTKFGHTVSRTIQNIYSGQW